MARKPTILWLALWTLVVATNVPWAYAQPPTNWMQSGPPTHGGAPQTIRMAARQATLGSGATGLGSDLFSSPSGSGLSSGLNMDDGLDTNTPEPSTLQSDKATAQAADGETILTPMPEDGWDADGGFAPEPPAPLCSSGSLINRGCWYTQLDVMYLSRSGPRPFTLGADITASTQTGQVFNLIPLRTPTALGFEPGARATIGKFLGRDDKNRDYSLEITYLGGFDYYFERALRAQNNLIVSAFRGAPSGFNFASEQRFTYGSDLNNVEANFRVSRRLGRDRMELNPCTGDWVRKSASGPLPSVFMGIRGIGIEEGFGYFSEGVVNTAAQGQPATNVDVNGTYLVKTRNYMFGPQLGADVTWQNALWKFGARVKGGGLVNFTDQRSDVSGVNAVSGNPVGVPFAFQTRKSGNVLAFVGEVNLTGAYYLRPNLALRATADFMWINQAALASEQITFVDPVPRVFDGGELLYAGGGLGLEYVW